MAETYHVYPFLDKLETQALERAISGYYAIISASVGIRVAFSISEINQDKADDATDHVNGLGLMAIVFCLVGWLLAYPILQAPHIFGAPNLSKTHPNTIEKLGLFLWKFRYLFAVWLPVPGAVLLGSSAILWGFGKHLPEHQSYRWSIAATVLFGFVSLPLFLSFSPYIWKKASLGSQREAQETVLALWRQDRDPGIELRSFDRDRIPRSYDEGEGEREAENTGMTPAAKKAVTPTWKPAPIPEPNNWWSEQ